MPDRCPCCGTPVRVYSAREGTNSYESLAEEAIREALDAIEWMRTVTRSWPRLGHIAKILRRGLGEEP